MALTTALSLIGLLCIAVIVLGALAASIYPLEFDEEDDDGRHHHRDKD